ncbi:MAG: hydrogenase maturation nickel metallochaperone HypA [Spirochaetes bacterium GWF1_49_6]|nr:MAG: hydrogenase maturation nickel metallochaperone HypA [Spirochaetes bacterium GWF1_49_6]
MHEYPAVEQIVKIALRTAGEHHAKRVIAVNIAIGELTGFAEESLQFYFDIMKKETTLTDTVLNIRYITPQLKCSKCGHIFERAGRSFDCPECGGKSAPTTHGTEFFIENIEIETEE